MKTAMQELVEHLEFMDLEGTSVYHKAKELLEKEKDQLYHSFYAGGGVTSIQDFFEEFTEYYNQIYNQTQEKIEVKCDHPIRSREYFPSGMFKCWECGKIPNL